jgi:hypothetical protein
MSQNFPTLISNISAIPGFISKGNGDGRLCSVYMSFKIKSTERKVTSIMRILGSCAHKDWAEKGKFSLKRKAFLENLIEFIMV